MRCLDRKKIFVTRIFMLFFGVLALSLIQGCGASRMARWGETGKASGNVEQAAKLEAQGDEAFAKRSSEMSLKHALKLWQTSSDLAPNDRIFAKLARGHYFLGDGFYGLRGEEKKRDEHFTVGLGFAEKSLKHSAPEVITEVDHGVKFYQAIKGAPKEAVPGMYWYAACLGKWAASKGFITRLRYKDDIKATMDRVMELDQDYFFAGPWRYSGAYQAVTAGLAGGSLDKSVNDFETAVKMAPDYLGTKVLWAEYWCTKKQDKATFTRLIEEVLAADPNVNPLIMAENKVEQAKAHKLRASIEDLF